LGILTTGNKNSSRVEVMALNNIKFSACQNTMRGFKKRTGHFPTLTDGVKVAILSSIFFMFPPRELYKNILLKKA
jgi:intracellular sulfur oxidation DsrE/DsrF family protein